MSSNKHNDNNGDNDTQTVDDRANSADGDDSINSLTHDVGNLRLRLTSSSLDNLRSSQKAPCRNGLKCFNSFCQYNHPSGWKACECGAKCREFDCQANHPFDRQKRCRNGAACRRCGCEFLHPVKLSDKCRDGVECRLWNCEKWHPRDRPKICPFGKQCYNTTCQHVHPSDRQLCPHGGECTEINCQLDHPKSRAIACPQASSCDNYFCQRLHPDDWNPCKIGSDCENSICSHTCHPLNGILSEQQIQSDVEHQSKSCSILKSVQQRNIEREKTKLPILAAKDEFCQRLEKERVLVITAETGSGKSTQLPQYAAEYFGGLVVCTQPRVITAMSLARRVAEEYDGISVGKSVGYRVGQSSVGRERNRVPGTDILFMTDAIFIQESQDDDQLGNVRVLIIDEAHERSLNTDIVLGIAKLLLITRSTDFYVVIASATIDPAKFLKFFQRTNFVSLTVPGRIYDVSVEYNPFTDKSLLQHAVSTIQNLYDKHQGHTLVFLPGQREIKDAIQLFNQRIPDNCVALPLYSALSLEEQDRVLQFDEDSNGVRRMVVFCTNIAETSLTIKDTCLVIDSGLVKQPRFDHENRLTVIETVQISRSSADQRKGRAGRTAQGHCVRLYDENDLTRPDIEPEILRASLDRAVLQLVYLELNPQEFPLIDQPEQTVIETSLELLKDLSCIDDDQIITKQGKLFAKLGLDPRYSAFLIDTYLEHAEILELVVTIVAILSAPGSLFSVGGLTDEEKQFVQNRIVDGAKKHDSDLLHFVSIYKNWHIAGALDPIKRTCLTCRKTWKMEYSCRECRAAHSRSVLLNNKILNIVENVYHDLIETINGSRWQLNPESLSNANESDIIGSNLYKYFSNQYGIFRRTNKTKLNAHMVEKGFDAGISDTSIFAHRATTNPHFIAMSLVKLSSGRYLVDRLHPFQSPGSFKSERKDSNVIAMESKSEIE
ncbi:unnamed protein product [Rotaria sp. Silwood1]|nr:unnamed protein product [Rotaria sp. Silwood1]